MFQQIKKAYYICSRYGEMAEWSNAAVLKTVEGHTSGGSNPSFSADQAQMRRLNEKIPPSLFEWDF